MIILLGLVVLGALAVITVIAVRQGNKKSDSGENQRIEGAEEDKNQ